MLSYYVYALYYVCESETVRQQSRAICVCMFEKQRRRDEERERKDNNNVGHNFLFSVCVIVEGVPCIFSYTF
jgi:hypothetical protein